MDLITALTNVTDTSLAGDVNDDDWRDSMWKNARDLDIAASSDTTADPRLAEFARDLAEDMRSLLS